MRTESQQTVWWASNHSTTINSNKILASNYCSWFDPMSLEKWNEISAIDVKTFWHSCRAERKCRKKKAAHCSKCSSAHCIRANSICRVKGSILFICTVSFQMLLMDFIFYRAKWNLDKHDACMMYALVHVKVVFIHQNVTWDAVRTELILCVSQLKRT